MIKREIKFRVFDPAINKYMDSNNFQISANGEDTKYVGVVEINDNSNSAMCIIQQFTGLKDVNGKDIFEGDIIKSNKGNLHLIRYESELAAFVGNIYNSVPKLTDYCSITQNWIIKYKKEVVGNKFENPELLT